jgi:hypothetical protein
MSCKGICISHKASGRYATGHKRCKKCDLFIEWDGLRCQCCGYILRTRRRNFQFKAELREQERAIELAKKITIFSHSYTVCLRRKV